MTLRRCQVEVKESNDFSLQHHCFFSDQDQSLCKLSLLTLEYETCLADETVQSSESSKNPPSFEYEIRHTQSQIIIVE